MMAKVGSALLNHYLKDELITQSNLVGENVDLDYTYKD